MSEKPESAETTGRVCPTCGTRLDPNAKRCLVCGTEFGSNPSGGRAQRRQITLSLPIALVLLAAFSLIAAGLTFAATRMLGEPEDALPEVTPSSTPTETQTPEPTGTDTPIPTFTPLPTLEYTVLEGDTCLGIAVRYAVSVQSIQNLNPGLVCELLSLGQKMFIPQPTPTASPEPTATLPPAEATLAACETILYTVEANDTLSGIAGNYNVEMRAIMDYNGMVNETVFLGQVLIIPLCERLPTPGPSPTATPPPPYPAPNLLLPADGAAFTLAHDTVTLQWASVGALRENERYQVSVEDITEGSGTIRLVEYVTDTKYIVPTNMRPQDPLPHVLRWWVEVVREIGASVTGEPRYESGGAVSLQRDFTWSGAAPGATPTP